MAVVIVAQLGAGGALFAEGAEAVVYGLTQRLEGFETVGPTRGMHAEALAGTVIDDDENRSVALAGERRDQVGAPHLVDARCGPWSGARTPRGEAGA